MKLYLFTKLFKILANSFSIRHDYNQFFIQNNIIIYLFITFSRYADKTGVRGKIRYID